MNFTRAHFDSLGMVHLEFPDGSQRTAWPIDARDFIAAGAKLLTPKQQPTQPAKAESPAAPADVGMSEAEMSEAGIE